MSNTWPFFRTRGVAAIVYRGQTKKGQFFMGNGLGGLQAQNLPVSQTLSQKSPPSLSVWHHKGTKAVNLGVDIGLGRVVSSSQSMSLGKALHDTNRCCHLQTGGTGVFLVLQGRV